MHGVCGRSATGESNRPTIARNSKTGSDTFAPVTSSVCSLPPPAPFFLHRAAVCFGSIIHLPIAVQYSVLYCCISRQSEGLVRTLNGNHCWKQLPTAGEICTPGETNTYLTKNSTDPTRFNCIGFCIVKTYESTSSEIKIIMLLLSFNYLQQLPHRNLLYFSIGWLHVWYLDFTIILVNFKTKQSTHI